VGKSIHEAQLKMLRKKRLLPASKKSLSYAIRINARSDVLTGIGLQSYGDTV
jgi:hypothetical protein